MDYFRNSKGRGSSSNEESRFHSVSYTPDLADAGWVEEDDLPNVRTEFFPDTTRTILSKNNSPDIGFTYSINPYRGCEHGCVYCYARPTHEYLGHSAGLDFESKIYFKAEAPRLLRKEFMSQKWKPEVVAISGITDCYQPAERRFQLTRECLKVFAEFRNPVALITKNFLVTRDLDILQELAKDRLVAVTLSITTMSSDLARKLEPRTSSPERRIKAIETLAKAGIPVGVNIAPVIPGLNDSEIPVILKRAADMGATSAGYVPVRLPHSVKDLFCNWLEENFPEKRKKVLHAIQDIRGGNLYTAEFGSRMTGEGERAMQIHNVFQLFSRKFGLQKKEFRLSTSSFRRPGDQLSLLAD